MKNGLCNTHYRRLRVTGTVDPPQRVDHWQRYAITDDGCWQWTGPLYRGGYGHFPKSFGDLDEQLAHRAFYRHIIGPIPAGMDLDHLCRNRACVNPQHLEPVTRQVNLERGIKARLGDKCQAGLHDMTEPNAWYSDASHGRTCRRCKAIREKRGRDRRLNESIGR